MVFQPFPNGWFIVVLPTHPLPGHDGIYGDWIFAATGGWQKQKTSAAHGSSTMPSSTQAVSVRYSFVHLQFRDCQWRIISEYPCVCLWNSDSGSKFFLWSYPPCSKGVNVWEFQIQVPQIDGLVLLDSFSGNPWTHGLRQSINPEGAQKKKVQFKENTVENPWGLFNQHIDVGQTIIHPNMGRSNLFFLTDDKWDK